MLCATGKTHSAFNDHSRHLKKKKKSLGYFFFIKGALVLVRSSAVIQAVRFKMLYHHFVWPDGGLSALDMQPGDTNNAA